MARARRISDDDDDDTPPRRRRPRDEDYDDDRPRRRKPAKDQTPKVLLILGGVLVVVLLICCGTVLYIYNSAARGVNQVQRQMQQDLRDDLAKAQERQAKDRAAREQAAANSDKAKATAAVNAFLAEVRGGRADAAYQLTTPSYRQRVGEREFARLLEKEAQALSRGMPTVSANLLDPDSGSTYSYEIWAGFSTVRVTAVGEGGRWAIDRFAVGAR